MCVFVFVFAAQHMTVCNTLIMIILKFKNNEENTVFLRSVRGVKKQLGKLIKTIYTHNRDQMKWVLKSETLNCANGSDDKLIYYI